MLFYQKSLTLPQYTTMRSIAVDVMDDLMAGTPKTKTKIKKLGKKLQSYLDDDAQTKVKQQKALKKVLRKLKRRQSELEESLATASGADEARTIKKHVAVVRAMRKKGLTALKDSK